MFVEPRVSSRLSVITEPIDLLRKRVTGEILTVSHPEYDAARKVVAMTVNRFPSAIVKVESAEDVAATVDFAREIGFPLAIRSGGHSIAQYTVIDDSILIDFSKFKRVSVDPASGIAKVQAGYRAAQQCKVRGTGRAHLHDDAALEVDALFEPRIERADDG